MTDSQETPEIATQDQVNAQGEVSRSPALGCILFIIILLFVIFMVVGEGNEELFRTLRSGPTSPAMEFVGPLPPEGTEAPSPSPIPQQELPPEGTWFVTYTPGGMVCPGVFGVPAIVKDPHNVTITHQLDEGISLLVGVPGEGDVVMYPGVLPEHPEDSAITFTPDLTATAITTQISGTPSEDPDIGTINPAGVSVDSQSDLLPHPTIFTGTVQAGLTVTYQLEYNQGNTLWGISETPSENETPSGAGEGAEEDSPRAGDGKIYGTISNKLVVQGVTCYTVIYAEMEFVEP